jgi:hypothetical protein
MKWSAMILVTMAVLVGQASAQQNAPQTNAIIVKEPVFQTDGPYKVQEMMEPSLARHTVYRPIDLKTVKGKLPIVAFGNGGCSMIGYAGEDMSDGPMMLIPILIISSRRAFSYVPAIIT